MSSRWVIELMILALSFSVVMIVWPGMRRFLLGFFRNSALGLILLWTAGMILGARFQVGLNLITGSVCGVLGLPGAALLLVLQGLVL